MISIKKILVGIDFSEHSNTAVQYAAEFARQFDAEVIGCYVAPDEGMLAMLHPGSENYLPPQVTEVQLEESQKSCEELLAKSNIPRYRAIIERGEAFVALVQVARDEDVDLVIVGTHGRGALAHMLLGSTAERVVRKASCPVLTVRHGEHDFVMP